MYCGRPGLITVFFRAHLGGFGGEFRSVEKHTPSGESSALSMTSQPKVGIFIDSWFRQIDRCFLPNGGQMGAKWGPNGGQTGAKRGKDG
jgi:hypothetical protein